MNQEESTSNSESSINIECNSKGVINGSRKDLKCDEIELKGGANAGNRKKVTMLIKMLDAKSVEVDELQNKLRHEIEMHETCRKQRSNEIVDQLEEEKQIYEQKLNAIRSNFNQQLKMFEHNERNIMQDKINSLQMIYNDLKLNYKKNLDKELKSLRAKLHESQELTGHLTKQLQTLQISGAKEKAFNAASTQTLDHELNCSHTDLNGNSLGTELIFFMKKLKNENNELKFQLDSERRSFQREKDKWSKSQASSNLDHQQSCSTKNLNLIKHFSNEPSNKSELTSNQIQKIRENMQPVNGSMINLTAIKQQLGAQHRQYQPQKNQF